MLMNIDPNYAFPIFGCQLVCLIPDLPTVLEWNPFTTSNMCVHESSHEFVSHLEVLDSTSSMSMSMPAIVSMYVLTLAMRSALRFASSPEDGFQGSIRCTPGWGLATRSSSSVIIATWRDALAL